MRNRSAHRTAGRYLILLGPLLVLTAAQTTPIPAHEFIAVSDLAKGVQQLFDGSPSAQAQEIHRIVDSLDMELDPGGALAEAEKWLSSHGRDTEMLWRSARELLWLGMMVTERDTANTLYDKAIDRSKLALEISPGHLEATYWWTASMGQRALSAGMGQTARLAEAVFREAHRILEIDPHSADAHFALGTLHSEVQKLSWLERFLGRLLLSADIPETSWEEGEFHLLESARLQPNRVRVHLELGKLYMRTDRQPLARRHFRLAVDAPVRRAPDFVFKARASDFLESLPPAGG